jgi:hypothetical protein
LSPPMCGDQTALVSSAEGRVLKRSRKIEREMDRDETSEGGRVKLWVNVRRKRGGCDSQLQVWSAVGVDTGELRTVQCVWKRGGAQRWDGRVGLRCTLKRRRRWELQGT